MADDAVDRAARVRESLAWRVDQVRGAERAKGGEQEKQRRHARDVNALLDHTRSVIEHTRRVIEQTKTSLQRIAGKGDGDSGGSKND